MMNQHNNYQKSDAMKEDMNDGVDADGGLALLPIAQFEYLYRHKNEFYLHKPTNSRNNRFMLLTC